jgi:putative oxidoreductase
MLGITRKDFIIQSINFNLKNPWNILRLTVGVFLLPHAFAKFVNGSINPAVLGFFDKAGFNPPETWVLIAFLAEIICAIALIMGICSRFAAIGAAITLIVATAALHVVKGFSWYWNVGGYEYPVFWAIICICLAMHEFQRKN